MNTGGLIITEAELAALVERRVAEVLTPERLDKLASDHIDQRIGQLTLAEAAPRLRCKNVRQMREACRVYQIPIQKLGAKKEFVLLKDIEAAIKRHTITLPPAEARSGTTVQRVSDAHEERSQAA